MLFDAPSSYWDHQREVGAAFQAERRAQGRPPVDDPWRGVAELVVGVDGKVRVCHTYQHCEDYPNPLVLTAAAQLSTVGRSPSR